MDRDPQPPDEGFATPTGSRGLRHGAPKQVEAPESGRATRWSVQFPSRVPQTTQPTKSASVSRIAGSAAVVLCSSATRPSERQAVQCETVPVHGLRVTSSCRAARSESLADSTGHSHRCRGAKSPAASVPWRGVGRLRVPQNAGVSPRRTLGLMVARNWDWFDDALRHPPRSSTARMSRPEGRPLL